MIRTMLFILWFLQVWYQNEEDIHPLTMVFFNLPYMKHFWERWIFRSVQELFLLSVYHAITCRIFSSLYFLVLFRTLIFSLPRVQMKPVLITKMNNDGQQVIPQNSKGHWQKLGVNLNLIKLLPFCKWFLWCMGCSVVRCNWYCTFYQLFGSTDNEQQIIQFIEKNYHISYTTSVLLFRKIGCSFEWLCI